MKLNNKIFRKHVVTTLSLGGIAAAHAASVDNVGLDALMPQNGSGDLNYARILNGESAKREDFPYIQVVSAFVGDAPRMCHASLISDKIVITAASCFSDKNGELTKYVNATGVFIGTGASSFSPMAYIITRGVHVHPDFSPVTLENDIAAIELNTTIPKIFATPVAIYSGSVTDDMNLVTAGWDLTSTGLSDLPDKKLNRIAQSPSSSSVCKDANANWSDNNKNVVCTLVNNDKGLANGDSGSPLTYVNNKVNLLVGIASNTGRSGSGATILPENAKTNYYTHVYSYIDWIVKVTGIEKSYLLDTTARPSPDYSKINDTNTDTD
ncbi:Mannan-binding lectin serine protease 1, partial [Zancudomyces culisetae]